MHPYKTFFFYRSCGCGSLHSPMLLTIKFQTTLTLRAFFCLWTFSNAAMMRHQKRNKFPIFALAAIWWTQNPELDFSHLLAITKKRNDCSATNIYQRTGTRLYLRQWIQHMLQRMESYGWMSDEWIASDEWWVISDEWWVMSDDEWGVMVDEWW